MTEVAVSTASSGPQSMLRFTRNVAGTFSRLDSISRVAAGLLFCLIVVGAFGSLLPLGDPRGIGVGPRLAPPSASWILGTDTLGRSILPRVVEGIRATLLLAMSAVSIMTLIGVFAGMLAAYRGGLVEQVVMRIADILFSFPALLLALLVAAILGPGIKSAIVSAVWITLPLMLRVVRAASLSIISREFVAAAEVAGASVGRILVIHLLPNISGTVAVQATYAISIAMLVESGLSFLGLGVQAPDASLGSLVREGTPYLVFAPWTLFPAATVLAAAILSVNLVGDGLRDILDPREARILR